MKTYELEMTEKGKLFFKIFYEVFGNRNEDDAPIDPEEARETLLKTRSEDLKQMFFEFGVNEFIDAIISIGELADDEQFVKDDEQFVKDMKKLVKYLKNEWSMLANDCGEDDEFNTIPAKKAYKRAKRIYKHMKGTPCD